jgi:Uma2 family endonuclease
MAAPAEELRPLQRVEYDQLIALGVFIDERIELLDGALVKMSPIGPPHSSTVQRLTELLVIKLAGRASVRVQSPFAAGPISEPEPDVAVVPLGSYDDAHPDRAYLIIEVSESSLAKDRGAKARIYAECGVPEYWVVNLPARRLEIYQQPVDGSYQQALTLDEPSSVVALPNFPDVRLRLDAIIK